MADFADIAESAEAEQRADALAEIRRNRDAQQANPSLAECEACGEDIPRERQLAVKGVRLCIECQTEFELRKKRGLA